MATEFHKIIHGYGDLLDRLDKLAVERHMLTPGVDNTQFYAEYKEALKAFKRVHGNLPTFVDQEIEEATDASRSN